MTFSKSKGHKKQNADVKWIVEYKGWKNTSHIGNMLENKNHMFDFYQHRVGTSQLSSSSKLLACNRSPALQVLFAEGIDINLRTTV